MSITDRGRAADRSQPVGRTTPNKTAEAPPDSPIRRRAIRITGLQAGVILALAAVAAGTFLEVRPPEA